MKKLNRILGFLLLLSGPVTFAAMNILSRELVAQGHTFLGPIIGVAGCLSAVSSVEIGIRYLIFGKLPDQKTKQ